MSAFTQVQKDLIILSVLAIAFMVAGRWIKWRKSP